MNISVGIVGFPNAGKSTLFNALLKRQAAGTAPYPFCTIEPNVGIVPVPDERLAVLAKIVSTDRIVPVTVEFVDIAGLVKGAHKGEGLGNQFLGHIKEVNIILFLLRGFELVDVDKAGSADPETDLEALKTELLLKDLDTLEKQKEPKGAASKEEKLRWQAVLKAKAFAAEGKYLFDIMAEKDREFVCDLCLLTLKDYMVGINVLEKDLADAENTVKKYSGLDPFVISAKTEEDLASMSENEQKEYLAMLEVGESSLQKLIKKAYKKLNLISFLTAGTIEARAWTIKDGTLAPQAAGAIHTDFVKKFIKAKVASYKDFVSCRGWKNCASGGKIRMEGKDYVMQDGDIVEFIVGK